MHFETIYDIQQAGIKDPYVPFAGLFFAGGGPAWFQAFHVLNAFVIAGIAGSQTGLLWAERRTASAG